MQMVVYQLFDFSEILVVILQLDFFYVRSFFYFFI